MILTQKMRKRFVAVTVVTIFASIFFLGGNQRQVHAVVNPDLGNLGSEIVCFVFSQLNGVGSPIPVLSAGDCQNPPSEPPQCSDGIDNDGDGLIDFPTDTGCTSINDNTEAPNPTPPTPPSDPPFQCNDGIDNDSDGKIDLVDPGCSNQADTDETDPPPPNDGGGNPQTPPINQDQGGSTGSSRAGGRSGGFNQPVASTSGMVLGAETCEEYLLEYIKFGAKNTPNEVSKLQRFLRDLGGFANLKETGVYDAATLSAVHAFQKTNAAQILTPWGATRSTGFVYYTTKKTINEIYCKFIRKFPLTSQQEAEIVRVKTSGQSWRIPNPIPLVPPVAPKNTKPAVPASPSSEQPKAGGPQTGIEQNTTVGASADSVPTRGWFNNFFNWFRGR